MMNRGTDRVFVVNSVATSGRSLNLGKGEFAIVDLEATPTEAGLKVLGSFAGLPKDRKLQIRLGKADLPVNRSQSNKPYASLPFNLKDVKELRVSAPKQGIVTDELIIGYNGFDSSTALTLEAGDNEEISIELSGPSMGMLGYVDSSVIITEYLTPPSGTKSVAASPPAGTWTDHQVVEEAVIRLKNKTLLGGIPITNYVDITPVNSANPAVGAITDDTDYTFFSLTLEDAGDYTALGLVQAQVPDYKVIRTDRTETESVYTVIAPTTTVTAGAFVTGTSYEIVTVGTTDFQAIGASADTVGVQFTATGAGSGTGTAIALPAVSFVKNKAWKVKGCADCPSGYSEYEDGYVYSITIEDDGADSASGATVTAGSFVTDVEYRILTVGTTDFTAIGASASTVGIRFVATGAGTGTGTAEVVSAIEGISANTVPDSGTRVSQEGGLSTYTVVTTAALTDEEIAAFVETNPESEISLVSEDVAEVCSPDNSTTTFWDAGETCKAVAETYSIVIPNDDCNVAPTAAIQAAYPELTVTFDSSANCASKYTTDILSNIVCEECSDDFRDLFLSKAPQNYGVHPWTKADKTYDGTALMGIRIKAKPFVFSGNEQFRDWMPSIATSTRIKAAGGYATAVNQTLQSGEVAGRFAVTILSVASEPENWGMNLREWEDAARVYFDGTKRLAKNNYGKWALGQESNLEGTSPYVDYILTIRKDTLTQGVYAEKNETMYYHFYVQPGLHQSVESLLNALAAEAGVTTVQAYGKTAV